MDKDEYLDALFDSEPLTETRSALSRRADEQFISEALATDDAVVVSFWRRPELSESSGTPTAWLEQSDNVVEVFCDCPPLVAVRRFDARRRHVRHDDQTRSTKDLLDQFTALAALGPIGLGSLVRVNTGAHVDVDAVTATERRLAAAWYARDDHPSRPHALDRRTAPRDYVVPQAGPSRAGSSR